MLRLNSPNVNSKMKNFEEQGETLPHHALPDLDTPYPASAFLAVPCLSLP
jgi:hypothetical protein